MLGSGILMLALGIPCIVLGAYLRKAPAAPAAGKKGKKKKAKEATPGGAGGGASLIVGGVLFSLIGVGFIAAHFLR